MSTTSQKHRNFVAEPMNEKPVTDLAGIGEVLGKRLESKGFDKAYVVLGQVIDARLACVVVLTVKLGFITNNALGSRYRYCTDNETPPG
jgi:hypothetical protein